MSAQRRGRSAPAVPPRLDFGWWASNGPTAGYLMRLALDAVDGSCDPSVTPRRVDLHVLRRAAAATFDITVSAQTGAADVQLRTVSFGQGQPFAVASVLAAHDRGPTAPGDARPPTALPREMYRPMDTSAATLPPVTSRFTYRPTTETDGSGPRRGWDVVWATPTDPGHDGHQLVASLIDCWFPANYMRAARHALRTCGPVVEPPPTSLVAATVNFTAPGMAYQDVRHALLANQISAISDGHYFERSEVWSEAGQLLATGELLRRNEAVPS